MPGFNKQFSVFDAAVSQSITIKAKPKLFDTAVLIEQPPAVVIAHPHVIDVDNSAKISPNLVVAFTHKTLPKADFLRANLAMVDLQFFLPLELNAPKPRAQIKVPISTSGIVNSDTLFEDPADRNKKLALPFFNLAEQTVAGVNRLRVTFERVLPIDAVNQKWQLSVHFGAAHRSPNAEDLPFTTSVWLHFTPPIPGAAAKEMAFTIEQEDSATMKASLQMVGIPGRDQVVNALKSLAYQARFIVRCSFSAAVPDSVNPSGEQLYRQSSYVVDVPLNVDPFVFDPALHPAIFSEVQDVSDKVFGLKLHQVEYKGRTHHYYQDEASPYIFYYLPDSFKVTRNINPPFNPQIIVHFSSEDGSLEKMKVSLEYVAAPVINAERLQAAQSVLKPFLPTPMPPTISEAVFQPLVVDDISQLTLNLAVPRQGAGGISRQPRPGVVKKLSEGFQDEIDDLSMQNFQDLFDAMFGKSAVVFTGDVTVAKSGDRPAETIPFNVRLDDLYGRLLLETETSSGDGRSAVKLKNSIESPLTIRSMPVHFFRDGQIIAAHIENQNKNGISAPFPVDLSPAEELSLEVVSDEFLSPGEAVPDAMFDLDDVVVRSDTAAVWNTILDASVPAEYTRKISVMGFAEWFAPATDVMAIALDFANGDHVVLKGDHILAEAQVHVPVSDLILRKVQDSQYTYTQVVIRTTGQSRSVKTDTLDILFPDLNP
jgi:hypothetical protein